MPAMFRAPVARRPASAPQSERLPPPPLAAPPPAAAASSAAGWSRVDGRAVTAALARVVPARSVLAGAAVVAVAAALAVAWLVAGRSASEPEGAPTVSKVSAAADTLPLVGVPGASTPASAPAPAVPGSSSVATVSTVPAGSSSVATVSTIAVHAAGAVVRPGVYVLPPDARVDDLLAAAGGVSADADGDAVNLAAHLTDAERVYVPHRGQTVPAVRTGTATAATADPGGTTGGAAVPTGPIDLNTATAAQLDTLPGVGPATAAAILEYRQRHGSFRSVTQLLDVPGIGDAKFAAIRPKVTVGS